MEYILLTQGDGSPVPTWADLGQGMTVTADQQFALTAGLAPKGPSLLPIGAEPESIQKNLILVGPRAKSDPGRTHSLFCCFEIEIKFEVFFKKKSSGRLQITAAQCFPGTQQQDWGHPR